LKKQHAFVYFRFDLLDHHNNLRSHKMKIDIHTHIMPEHMPNWTKKFGYGEFIHLEHRNCEACMMKGDKLFRVVEPNCFKAEERLKEMDATDVTVQVLSTIPVLFNYWANAKDGLETSRFFNDHIAEEVSKAPGRFIGIGTVPLQDIDLAIKEMERCVAELKMPGLEIGSNINGKNLSDSFFFPFYEAAEKLGCALFVHPWEMMGEGQMQKYWLPWLVGMPAETTRAICSMIFGGVFEKFPELRVAFAHGGGSFPYTLGRIEHGFDVRPDLVAIDNAVNPRQYLDKFWVDSLVHDPKAFRYLMDVMGDDKICLGSDYPFPLGEHHPGKLIEGMNFDDELSRKLLYENANNWLETTSSMSNQAIRELTRMICSAIQERRVLSFYYESESSGKKEWRTVRPYLVGINKKGNLEFAGLPESELSKQNPDKRNSGHYLLTRLDLNKFKVLPDTFEDPEVLRERVIDTPTMKAISCRFIYSDEDPKRVMKNWIKADGV
jgi:aminocarboxymuconate-semialdehyde decarboxylase